MPGPSSQREGHPSPITPLIAVGVGRLRSNRTMAWQESWRSTFGGEPPIPYSREESIQDVLSRLIAGRTCDWFTPYTPTPEGRAFLSSLWGQALS